MRKEESEIAVAVGVEGGGGGDGGVVDDDVCGI